MRLTVAMTLLTTTKMKDATTATMKEIPLLVREVRPDDAEGSILTVAMTDTTLRSSIRPTAAVVMGTSAVMETVVEQA